MKSIKIFATVGAIALLGMTGLSSCKTNNGPEDPKNPGNYSGETVKTEIMIHIADKAAANSGVLRMPGKIVQDDAHFRGMDSIRLLPFSSDAYTTRTGKTDIRLAQLAANGLVSPSKSKVYTDVSIPLGTKNFLFYAQAIDTTTAKAPAGSVAYKHLNGVVDATSLYANMANNKATSAITFGLVQINSTSLVGETVAKNLAAYLTSIANAKDGSSNTWAAHSNEGIKALYNDFIHMEAGSSNAVLSLVTDLYNTLNRYQAEQSPADAVVAALLDSIDDVVELKGVATGNYTDTLQWKSAEVANYANYPENKNLPEGAAIVEWNTNKFDVIDKHALGNLVATTAGATYVYPPSLQYYAQSAILTSNVSRKDSFNSSHNWQEIKSYYHDGDSVSSSTASVVISDSINYGVGLLESRVKISSAASMKDSKEIERKTGLKLGLKGILVGDQKNVGYNFEQKTGDAYVIYDNWLEGKDTLNAVQELSESAFTTYTMVFSSENNTDYSKSVNVALELVNLGPAFYGVGQQLIPTGGTFYMVGAMTASALTAVGAGGGVPDTHNIFYKDIRTIANFTITNLDRAYYTIPDLRTEGLELGFSVDLAWQAGYIIDVIL